MKLKNHPSREEINFISSRECRWFFVFPYPSLWATTRGGRDACIGSPPSTVIPPEAEVHLVLLDVD